MNENLRRFRFRPVANVIESNSDFSTNFISSGCRLTRDKKISKNCRDMLFISPQLTEQKGKIGLLRKTL